MERASTNYKLEKSPNNEIGDSKESYSLQYFSLHKFIKNQSESTKLEKIICNKIYLIYSSLL